MEENKNNFAHFTEKMNKPVSLNDSDWKSINKKSRRLFFFMWLPTSFNIYYLSTLLVSTLCISCWYYSKTNGSNHHKTIKEFNNTDNLKTNTSNYSKTPKANKPKINQNHKQNNVPNKKHHLNKPKNTNNQPLIIPFTKPTITNSRTNQDGAPSVIDTSLLITEQLSSTDNNYLVDSTSRSAEEDINQLDTLQVHTNDTIQNITDTIIHKPVIIHRRDTIINIDSTKVPRFRKKKFGLK